MRLDRINLKQKKTERAGFFQHISQNGSLFLMIAPMTIVVFVFAYIPMAGIVVAFKNYNFTQGMFGSPWVGLDNLKFFFTSGKAWLLTANTITYNAGFMLVNFTLEILFAILLFEVVGKKLKKILQSIMILPYFISWVVIGGFVYSIFNYETGLLNKVLHSLSMEAVNVYEHPEWWRGIITSVCAIKIVGYGTVVFLAAISGINTEIYESASLDGASIFKRIWHITLPMLFPTISIMVLLTLGGILKGGYDMFFQLVGNNGGLYEATDIIDTFVFRSLVNTSSLGMSAAAGFYQQIVGFIIVVGVNYLIKKLDPEYALF